MENKNISQGKEEETGLSFGNLFKACAAKWRWFLISIICFTCLGVAYVVRKQPVYQRSMSILIKDTSGDTGASFASAASSMGFFSSNSNVNNELLALKSPYVMEEVVRRLNLNITYLRKGFPHGTTLYGSNQPFIVDFLTLDPSQSGTFRLDVDPSGKMTLYRFALITPEGDKIKYDTRINLPSLDCTMRTPLGQIKFSPNPRYITETSDEEETYIISISGFRSTVEYYVNQLKGDLADREAEIIDLQIKDVSIERADDILNTLLTVYTEQWMEDKNRVTKATSDFIMDRLAVIERELGEVETKITDYRSANLLVDLEASARMNMQQEQASELNIQRLSTQISMAKFLLDFIKNPANDYAVIPVNTGGASEGIEHQIVSYNTNLLQRNNLAAATSTTNPLVKDADARLSGQRHALQQGLSSQITMLEKELRVNEINLAKSKGEISTTPTMGKYLRSEERQQKVKEQLYLFLLQRREDNELKQSFTADNTRVITPPTGPVRPVAPKKMLIVGMAFLFGLLLPAGSVYLQESTNTKIRSRKDLEKLSAPIMGEIPYFGKKKTWLRKLFPAKKKHGKLETVDYRVEAGGRDVLNESFRIIRGNIDFMTKKSNDKVIMLTSFNPGSGKSFVSFNLAAAFALKGKRVLLIDCDLRHGSASQFVGMPSKGFSTFLTNNSSDWGKYVVKVPEYPNLDVLPIGHRPPNPAELLDSQEVKQLIEEAYNSYDYVFLDCPPVDVVVDTQILAQYVDRTIFVVRAGLFDKNALSDIDEMYLGNRFKGMSILLNGTTQQFSRYGSSGYYGSEYAAQD